MTRVCDTCGADSPIALAPDLSGTCCEDCAGDLRYERQLKAERQGRRARGEVFCQVCDAGSPIAHPASHDLSGGPFCEGCAQQITAGIEADERERAAGYVRRLREAGLEPGELHGSTEARAVARAWSRDQIRVVTLVGESLDASLLASFAARRRHLAGRPVRIVSPRSGSLRADPAPGVGLVVKELERIGGREQQVSPALAVLERWLAAGWSILATTNSSLRDVARAVSSTVPLLLAQRGPVISVGKPDPDLLHRVLGEPWEAE